jgi:hypothetical protein
MSSKDELVRAFPFFSKQIIKFGLKPFVASDTFSAQKFGPYFQQITERRI